MPPAGMVLIPAGQSVLGADEPEAFFRPAARIFVEAFYLDKTEVTHQQFAAWKPAHRYASAEGEYPVTHVTREEAVAYLASQGKRLPRASEWERAARGSDGRRYPWGNEWDPSKGNLTENGRNHDDFCSLGRMKPVGSFPSGASPFGCLDMCGNAWEWVSDLKDGRPVIRGGAFGYRERDCRASSYATEDVGFT